MDPVPGDTPVVDIGTQTYDSLCRELLAGTHVRIDASQTIAFEDGHRRLWKWLLDNQQLWSGNNRTTDVERLAQALSVPVPPQPVLAPPVGTPRAIGRLHLHSVRAYRFAGLHGDRATDVFEHEFTQPLTIVHGENGTGKTSLINAIAWCLTGRMLRTQRAPEAHAEVDIEVLAEHEDDAQDDDGELRRITGRVPSFAPIPSARSVAKHGVPDVDTWVEVTFAGADGAVLPPIRRAEQRSANGSVRTQEPDLGAVGMLPIDALAATLMPAQIAHMSLHASSDMGRAITEMLGFQPLKSVAEYARKSREKLSKAMPRDIDRALARIEDERFDPVRAALLEEAPSSLALDDTDVPEFDDPDVAERLDALVTRVDAAEAAALDRARAILGTTFDPTLPTARTALRKDATLATDKLAAAELDKTSGARLIRTLHDLAPEQIATEREHLARLTSQAAEIARLAANETLHARERLYALVAQDMSTNGLDAEHLDHCPVCRADLSDRTDPVSGDLVADHIRRMLQADAKHLAQTLTEWAGHADANLRARLPPELLAADGLDLGPVDLIASTVASALDAPCFRGELAPLTASTRNDVVAALGTLPAFAPTPPRTMPAGAELPASVTELERTVQRLQLAFDIAEWLHHHLDAASTRLRDVLGFSWPRRTDADAEAEAAPAGSVLDQLLAIDTTIEHAQPLQEANARLRSMQDADRDARALRTTRAQYAEAARLLPRIEALEVAFTRQMHEVVESMRDRTAEWKQTLYNPATSRAPRFRDIHVDAKGVLSLDTAVEGTTVSSWHVSNASDLRATLLAFLFAFRERLQAEGGGCSMLLLDDPQELFDDRNRISVAAGIARLAGDGTSTRVVLTTNSRRFAQDLEQQARSAQRGRERLEIFAAEGLRTISLRPHAPVVNDRRKAFTKSEGTDREHEAARAYACEMRIHLETCLGRVLDRFEERDKPGLSKLRTALEQAVKNRVPPIAWIDSFTQFLEDPLLHPDGECWKLLNRAHHPSVTDICWFDVKRQEQALSNARRYLESGCDGYFRLTELPRLRAADGRS